MYNQVTLLGRLGADPEMRYTPTGQPVTDFRLAVGKSWTNAEGQRQEKTVWVKITAWRKQAEVAAQYLRKGNLVLITGSLEDPEAYIDREGQPKSQNRVTLETLKLLPNAKGEGQSDDISDKSGRVVSEEDIPF